jgi:hypothetical protein
LPGRHGNGEGVVVTLVESALACLTWKQYSPVVVDRDPAIRRSSRKGDPAILCPTAEREPACATDAPGIAGISSRRHQRS